ncbi:MAG: FAD-dependent monooxygenase [Burkholderiales bacterium]|nr:FAD-dependent monooxygenase [Burkholderiales bacterium]
MSNLQEEVVIVGAGPVGLLLGCWLKKLGINVRVLEKRTARSTQSKASSMNAYSLVNLYALGIHDQFDALGKRVHDLNLYWQRKRLMHVNYKLLPSKYDHILCLAQPTTESLLEAHFLALGGRLQRGAEVVHLNQTNSDAVELYVHYTESSKAELLTSQYVIGCDGGKSVVRKQLGFSFEGRDHGTGFIMIDVIINWGGDVNCVHYFVSEGAFLILIPLSEGKHRIIIRTPQNEKERVLGNKLLNYQALVAQYGPSDLMLNAIVWESNTTYYNRLAEHYGRGHVLLAGDACHLFSSIGGLGMNTGFQDALALAWRLAGILRKRFSEAVLDSYELERRTLTQHLITSTNEMTALITQIKRDLDSLSCWMPIMPNRKRLKTLPLHFSGLGQRYEKGLLVENAELPVGQLVPYFEFTHQGRKLCSYDLIDGCYFYLIYNSDLLDKIFWLQCNECIKLIQLQNANDWRLACNRLNLQVGEAVLMRPDGIIAAKAATNNASNAFFSILKSINYSKGVQYETTSCF